MRFPAGKFRLFFFLIIIFGLINQLVLFHISSVDRLPRDVTQLRMSRAPDMLCQNLSRLFVLEPARGVDSQELPDMPINADDLQRAMASHIEQQEARNLMRTLKTRLIKYSNTTMNMISYHAIAHLCHFKRMDQARYNTGVKVGVVTLCRNEEYAITFVVAALLPHVDLYILIDTGSEDSTVHVVESFFKEEISSGKLVFLKQSIGTDVSAARNAALQILRKHRCDYVLKVDADDVFYDQGASALVSALKTATPPDVYMLWVHQYELVQSQVSETLPWLSSFSAGDEDKGQGRMLFRRLGHLSFGHDRVFKVENTIHAKGRWLDESKGLRAENFYYESRAKLSFFVSDAPVMVHYGWARPVNRLRLKLLLWDEWVPCCCRAPGRPEPQVGACEDSRCIDCRGQLKVGGLEEHLQDRILRRFQGLAGNASSYRGLMEFARHPEVLGRLVKNVSLFLQRDREEKIALYKRKIPHKCSSFSDVMFDSLPRRHFTDPACIISMEGGERTRKAESLCTCLCNRSVDPIIFDPEDLSGSNQRFGSQSDGFTNTSHLFIITDSKPDPKHAMEDWIKLRSTRCSVSADDELLVNLSTIQALAAVTCSGTAGVLVCSLNEASELRQSLTTPCTI
ncbi:hypothetical protein GUITHDRAFT_137586 [Guillardia theta CCMP2712]|uniref:Glycosyltransferase 2-like domain-containing protein n=1 Tax=Guillardia theta (strain CCMP2712) TaxID=905079 RepID=L1JH49_GUITC|nr:hypothetical protein GUITHDRAFT_137586 [Guillardia theta CCMP2712]EKX47420.1 hypothetical protein GUITHDRAFT_137586 [Guillardia theta CCMP2712]|eukprot:XP_005834400.1 hypothetical protein GUITHDRAFT_137586 [Guillardia theta CCMP2712]